MYTPSYKITINNFDVSSTIAPYLISINIEEIFSTTFEPTKLELIFHSKYTRSSSWKYKDLIKVELWWQPFPLFKYISPTFYVDYVDDIKGVQGQLFRISALSADPNLGFNYGVDSLNFTNKTIFSAVNDFATEFNLSLSQNLSANIYMGQLDLTPPYTDVSISFDSYADMLRYICNTFGYYGDIRGTELRLFKINTTFSSSSRFFVWELERISSLQYKQTYTDLYKEYKTKFIDRPSDVLTIGTFTPDMSSELNNKIQNIDFDKAWYNSATAAERLQAEIDGDFLSGFELTIQCSALPEFTAGNVFLLDSSYGANSGFYRCTKCVHTVDAGGWNAEIVGFPVTILESTSATFTVGYFGRDTIPSDSITITQNLEGISTVTGTQLDNYAKSVNPNYNYNLGSTYVSEGGKILNSMRADISFCIAMVVTNNFTSSSLAAIFNPGGLGNFAGDDLAIFPDWLIGIRAMIQRQYRYSTTEGTPADPIVDERYLFITRGSATTITQLQGKWTTNLDFSTLVISNLTQLHQTINPDKNIIIV
jgi:hypothetical protein